MGQNLETVIIMSLGSNETHKQSPGNRTLYGSGSATKDRFNEGISFFCPTTPQGGILDAPFSSTAAEAHLKRYLKEMGSDDGETLHGFRAGCAITLALSGAELSEIMDHVGWTRRHTALHYLQLAKVLNPAGASARLSTVDIPTVTSEWNDVNVL